MNPIYFLSSIYTNVIHKTVPNISRDVEHISLSVILKYDIILIVMVISIIAIAYIIVPYMYINFNFLMIFNFFNKFYLFLGNFLHSFG